MKEGFITYYATNTMKSNNYLILSASPPTLPARKLRLRMRSLYRSTRRRYTGKEQDSETGLHYYGARYLDSRTGRWLSGDPAVGDYVPQAPVNYEARKQNESLPGQGGVFNYVNLHVYHYGANNPVRYFDPNGMEIEIDFENKTIYADANDVQQLDTALNALMGFKSMEQWNDMKVITKNENGNSANTFIHPGELLNHIETLNPTMTETDKNRLVGGGFAILGIGVMGASVFAMKNMSASSEDGGAGKGFVLGLNMTLFGVAQMASGENIIGTPVDFAKTLLMDTKVDVIQKINDFRTHQGK